MTAIAGGTWLPADTRTWTGSPRKMVEIREI
jgi:hypothetical protein